MMKKQVKCIRICGMVCGRVGTVTTNEVYSSDHLPDRFKPLQYIIEIDDFTSMDITIQDIHYSITLEDTEEPPHDNEPGEHTAKVNGGKPQAVPDQEYYHEVQNRYNEMYEHHDTLVTHHQAVHDHHHLVQDRYHTWQKARKLQDRSHALGDYYKELLDHRRMVQDHQELLQQHYHLLLDLQSEENAHQHY